MSGDARSIETSGHHFCLRPKHELSPVSPTLVIVAPSRATDRAHARAGGLGVRERDGYRGGHQLFPLDLCGAGGKPVSTQAPMDAPGVRGPGIRKEGPPSSHAVGRLRLHPTNKLARPCRPAPCSARPRAAKLRRGWRCPRCSADLTAAHGSISSLSRLVTMRAHQRTPEDRHDHHRA